MSTKKIAVIGSRGFVNYALLEKILNEYSKGSIEKFISGGARAAYSLAERYAFLHGIEIEIIKADRDLHGDAAVLMRNRAIAEQCDELIAFWDGKSMGTKNCIEEAQRLNKPVRVVAQTQ